MISRICLVIWWVEEVWWVGVCSVEIRFLVIWGSTWIWEEVWDNLFLPPLSLSIYINQYIIGMASKSQSPKNRQSTKMETPKLRCMNIYRMDTEIHILYQVIIIFISKIIINYSSHKTTSKGPQINKYKIKNKNDLIISLNPKLYYNYYNILY
jgi:hypothetical protein